MIKNVRKRDGRLVEFEVDKIAGALYKAFGYMPLLMMSKNV